MGKIDQLTGIANNLQDSFLSPTNAAFLTLIQRLPQNISQRMNIDLLTESIQPKELISNKSKETIKKYRDWFISELTKLNITLAEIEQVSITLVYKSGNTHQNYFTCNVTIRARGEDYVGKGISFY